MKLPPGFKSSSFEASIDHHGVEIRLTIGYVYKRGKTISMGDNPDYAELRVAIDGTASNVIDKLSKEQKDCFLEMAYEHLLDLDI